MTDKKQQREQPALLKIDPVELDALISLVEARVVENLTRIFELLEQKRLQKRDARGT